MNEDSKIREIKGIGEKTEKLFRNMGIETVGDLLRCYPRGYDIYEDPVPAGEVLEGKVMAVKGSVWGSVQVSPNRKMPVTTAFIKDLTGTLKVVWFRMPFLRNTLKSGSSVVVRGRIVNRKGVLLMEHPELFAPAEKYEEKRNTMQPLYPLTAGISNQTVIKAVREALSQLNLKKETLPDAIRKKYHLCEYNYAIRGIHFPANKEMFILARERLVFEEFLEFVLAIKKLKEKKEHTRNTCPVKRKEEVDAFLAKLPFELTGAQKKVWEEIRENMGGPYAMSRLVQGDVGSGKTIVAVLALLALGGERTEALYMGAGLGWGVAVAVYALSSFWASLREWRHAGP